MGIPYYTKASNIRLIIQQPVINDKIDSKLASEAYPLATNGYHNFVRPYLMRDIGKWPKLSLESYQINSKIPFEIMISERWGSELIMSSILLAKYDELVLLRCPPVDHRLKVINQAKKVAACKRIECDNSKCKHRDEYIHVCDLTRIPHLKKRYEQHKND